MSRQALILRRRQTQHRSSCEEGLPGDPQTTQREGAFDRSTTTEALAFARISLGTTGSILGCGLRFAMTTSTIEQNPVLLQGTQFKSVESLRSFDLW
jgi:hypothetical protein